MSNDFSLFLKVWTDFLVLLRQILSLKSFHHCNCMEENKQLNYPQGRNSHAALDQQEGESIIS